MITFSFFFRLSLYVSGASLFNVLEDRGRTFLPPCRWFVCFLESLRLCMYALFVTLVRILINQCELGES